MLDRDRIMSDRDRIMLDRDKRMLLNRGFIDLGWLCSDFPYIYLFSWTLYTYLLLTISVFSIVLCCKQGVMFYTFFNSFIDSLIHFFYHKRSFHMRGNCYDFLTHNLWKNAYNYVTSKVSTFSTPIFSHYIHYFFNLTHVDSFCFCFFRAFFSHVFR